MSPSAMFPGEGEAAAGGDGEVGVALGGNSLADGMADESDDSLGDVRSDVELGGVAPQAVIATIRPKRTTAAGR